MTTLHELQAFHSYATHQLQHAGNSCSLEELLMQWRSQRERNEVNAAITESLQDIAAGRTTSSQDVLSEAFRRLDG